MKKIRFLTAVIVLFMLALSNVQSKMQPAVQDRTVSGTLVGGLRILQIQDTSPKMLLTVYRGDTIKFSYDESLKNPVLKIPAMSIVQTLSENPAEALYFKMKSTGTYDFTLGPVTGAITVIKYRQPSYKEVSSVKAAELIKKSDPLILDVRTPPEYRQGHLKNSVLIPVQELQSRLKELARYKNRDILIYCATGNRSTVASKILIDADFKQIINLRYGIVEWYMKKYPVVR